MLHLVVTGLFTTYLPEGIVTYAPVILLALLIILALVNFDYAAGAPNEVYTDAPMAAGLIEGYLTMDAIAALAFGIVVISALRYNGVGEGKPLATAAIIAGMFSRPRPFSRISWIPFETRK